MIALKGCPRCRGDLILEWLPGEAELVCLQCGYRAATTAQSARVPAGRLSRAS